MFDLDNQRHRPGAIVDDPATAGLERDAPLLTRHAPTARSGTPAALHVLFNGTRRTRDRVRSSEGDDTIRGNDGNDRLEGGDGNDNLDRWPRRRHPDRHLRRRRPQGRRRRRRHLLGPGLRTSTRVVAATTSSSVAPTRPRPSAGRATTSSSAATPTTPSSATTATTGSRAAAAATCCRATTARRSRTTRTTPGHDVLIGDGGEDDYDAEGGDDIMVAGPGIERNEGMLGFDWVTHKGDPQRGRRRHGRHRRCCRRRVETTAGPVRPGRGAVRLEPRRHPAR